MKDEIKIYFTKMRHQTFSMFNFGESFVDRKLPCHGQKEYICWFYTYFMKQ